MTGSTTAPVLRPGDLAEARAAVLDTSGPLAVAGAGTAAGWAGALEPVEAVLGTTALTGVITHNPGDMTVSVRAGTPLAALQEELASHGQHVAFDAARVADGATVGGLLATGDAGPAALVFGSLRDLVIGVTLVLSDGTVARSGGHVIKNVAGYDLAKLVHGSYGTLAVVAEVVLRLHPLAQATATLTVPCSLAEAAEHAATLLGGAYEPGALEWTSDGVLLVRVEASEGALPGRVERLREALGSAATVVGERGARSAGPAADGVADSAKASAPGPIAAAGEPARPADPWARHAELTRGGDGAVLRIGVRPSRLPALIDALPTSSVTAGLGTGVATVVVPADAVAGAHAAVHAAGGTSVARSSGVPAWGPPPSAIAVLRSVKRALDPGARLGPGRFDPWM